MSARARSASEQTMHSLSSLAAGGGRTGETAAGVGCTTESVRRSESVRRRLRVEAARGRTPLPAPPRPPRPPRPRPVTPPSRPPHTAASRGGGGGAGSGGSSTARAAAAAICSASLTAASSIASLRAASLSPLGLATALFRMRSRSVLHVAAAPQVDAAAAVATRRVSRSGLVEAVEAAKWKDVVVLVVALGGIAAPLLEEPADVQAARLLLAHDPSA